MTPIENGVELTDLNELAASLGQSPETLASSIREIDDSGVLCPKNHKVADYKGFVKIMQHYAGQNVVTPATNDAAIKGSEPCTVDDLIAKLVPEKSAYKAENYMRGKKKKTRSWEVFYVDTKNIAFDKVGATLASCPNTRLSERDVTAALNKVSALFEGVNYERPGCLEGWSDQSLNETEVHCLRWAHKDHVLHFEVDLVMAQELQGNDTSHRVLIPNVQTRPTFDTARVLDTYYDMVQYRGAYLDDSYGVLKL